MYGVGSSSGRDNRQQLRGWGEAMKMSTEYTVVIEKDEDGYFVGSVPALPGCHTQGTSIDQLLERMQEAIALWLEVEGEDAPRPLELLGN